MIFRRKNSIEDKLQGGEWKRLYREILIEGKVAEARQPVRRSSSQPKYVGANPTIADIIVPRAIRHIVGQPQVVTLLALLNSGNKNDHRDLAERILSDFKLPGMPFAYIPAMAVECEASEFSRVCSYLKRARGIAHVEPAHYLHLPEPEVRPTVCSSPVFDMWNLEQVGAYAAWDHTRGKNAVVGVIDTGIDFNHPHLRGRFRGLKGVNLVNKGQPPMDDHSHGTHVAGTIAGDGAGSDDHVVGVAPGATLYAVKALSAQGYGTEAWIVMGIEWCIDNQVDIINMSLGSPRHSSFIAATVKAAYRRGIITVAAAGNDGSSMPHYPGHLPGVIGVAAVDRQKQKASFSNWNSNNDVAAPGVDILSCVPGGGHAYKSGTSMATPCVAGCMALARSLSNKDPDDLEVSLKNTAERIGSRFDPPGYYGEGLVRADRLAAKLVGKALYASAHAPSSVTGGGW